MTQKFTASALLIAVASALTLLRAQEIVVPDTSTLVRMTARFAPTEIGADLSKLSAADRRVVGTLVEAAKIVDALFLRQAWSGNQAMLVDLARDDSPAGRARLHYFLINKGPWSRLDHNQPFIPGVPPKPAGASYYPDGATKAELERWMQSLSEPERARMASLLREAAQGTTDATLKNFLTRRADALLSNDYYDSDVAWMELNGVVQPTIGP